MNKIFSAIISSPLKGRLGGVLFALLATTTLWAYDFQSGDLYYNITSSSEPYTVEVTFQNEWSSDNYAGLTTATIPETVTHNGTTYSVTSIGYNAFCECSSLTSVTIPNSVTSIGDYAFYYCSALTSMVVESGNSTYDSRENCNAIIETATNTLIAGCQNTIIPNSVTSIGDYAFYGCSLTSITIPNSVTSIGEGAFRSCKSLTSMVVESGNSTYDSRENCNAIIESATNTLIVGCQNTIIPNSVTSIGYYAFYGCSSLTSVTIPNSVTSIGERAFEDCTNLTSVTIGNSVTSIGDYAFEDCSSLTSITIPNSVTSIGWGAFLNCDALTSITIPNSVTSIGSVAFSGCDALTSIVVESGNSTYDSRENCNAIIETATNTLIAGCQNMIIPNSVTSIGEYAFYFCSSLTSVTIPNSVTSIGDGAFWACSSLKTVICEAIEVPELGNNVFDYMPLSEATLYVPAQSLDDYKAAEQWKEFGTILPIEGESEEEIELQDTEMTIVFTNSEDNDSEIYRQTLTIKVPIAPTIAGFTFLYWQPVAEPITNEITIQAIYETNTPTSAEVYTNPANPAQKLLRNGQVYILQDGKTYTITGQRS